ncbi:hypothetical protein [Paraburkholderia solisilvae]|uniref:Uncharacterized protein n=1 Tax=Paraburkholderia solisilvae TaxID=624376 RepID=A0A6J5EDL3_9BURK|nr:hypothetical protein [Paraburkholderia solisilvae]CAB3764579.1 hypothetical protein LMG29739_04392 [Paraburkholderia solisilvae]
MKRRNSRQVLLIAACSIATCLMAACGGSSHGSGDATPTTSASGPHLITNIAVPNAASPAFSFDISFADHGRYFLADRNNKAVDVVDTSSNQLVAQIPGNFTGIGASTENSGPDGLVGLPGTSTLYVGDVNAVKILDTTAQTLTKTIPLTTSGNRVDEGCFDPVDHLVLMANPGDSPPFISFINTDTQTVVTQLTFPGSSGLEACAYDAGTQSFLINNDGTTANPDGELDVIPASSVLSGHPAVSQAFPLGACAPAGIALGPNEDVMVGCDPAAGSPLITLILDRTHGTVLAKLPFGGVDQITYDPTSNRYFLPARHWTANGIAAASGFTPQMAVVDGTSRSIVAQIAVGTGAHSVAVDGPSGQVYVPFQAGSGAFPNGGISVFTVR